MSRWVNFIRKTLLVALLFCVLMIGYYRFLLLI